MSYRFADSLRSGSWSRSQAVHKPVRHIPLLCVQWKTPDDGQRNCPKHVEFYSKNKFDKLVHLVGFIIRFYHDARSSERQIGQISLFLYFMYSSYLQVVKKYSWFSEHYAHLQQFNCTGCCQDGRYKFSYSQTLLLHHIRLRMGHTPSGTENTLGT